MAKAPDAFRTISEVAEQLETPAHVLRFWESKFVQVKPVKRAGGRRYYRPDDVVLLAGIKVLLHDNGMTIKGAQKVLREQGIKAVTAMAPATITGRGDDIDAVAQVVPFVPDRTASDMAAPDVAASDMTGPDVTGLPATTDAVVAEMDDAPATDEASPDDDTQALDDTGPLPSDDPSDDKDVVLPDPDLIAENPGRATVNLPADPAPRPPAPSRILGDLHLADPVGLTARRARIQPLVDRLAVLHRQLTQA